VHHSLSGAKVCRGSWLLEWCTGIRTLFFSHCLLIGSQDARGFSSGDGRILSCSVTDSAICMVWWFCSGQPTVPFAWIRQACELRLVTPVSDSFYWYEVQESWVRANADISYEVIKLNWYMMRFNEHPWIFVEMLLFTCMWLGVCMMGCGLLQRPCFLWWFHSCGCLVILLGALVLLLRGLRHRASKYQLSLSLLN